MQSAVYRLTSTLQKQVVKVEVSGGIALQSYQEKQLFNQVRVETVELKI